jgi:hypothetical protein
MSVAAHWRINATLIDDAYITYRYAANLATGKGLVYNPEEWILGTSTPAYALILGMIASATTPELIPVTARSLNAVLLLLTGAAAGMIGKRITGEPLVGIVLFGSVTLGWMTLSSSVAGMETSLFLALLSLGIWAMVDRRFWLSAVVIGLTPLVRPEGVFVVGVFGMVLVILHLRLQVAGGPTRSELFLSLVLILIPSIGWFLVSVRYYGSPIPHSIVAKKAGLYDLGVAYTVGRVVEHLVASSLLVAVSPAQHYLAQVDFITFIGLLYVVLTVFAVGAVWLVRREPSLLVLGPLLAIFVVFYATSSTLPFGHYFGNFEILATVCWWAGLYAIGTGLLSRWIGRPTRALRMTLSLATALIVLLPSFFHYPWSTIWHGEIDTNEIRQSVLRQAAYRTVAQQIAPHLPEDTVILMPEIGELGFFLDRAKILDACGLVSPETIPYLPVPEAQRPAAGVGVIPPDLVRDYQPDLIITLDVFGREGILNAPWFWRDYRPVMVLSGDWLPWDTTALYVLSRHDFKPGLALQNIVFDEP